jgi:hypothetical protein
MRLQLTTGVMLVAFSLLLGPQSAECSVFSFSGSDAGGTGSGTMEFLGMGTTSLTLNINNTSPLVLDDFTGVNSSAITGFGFDASAPIPNITSWALTAKDNSSATWTIGNLAGTGTNDWVMTDGVSGIQLDFFPTTDNGSKGALYNPLQSTGFGGPPQYFTEAVLSMEFDDIFNLNVHPSGTGGVDASPLMRFQNVGMNGEGSLKVPGDGGGGGGGGGVVPEPAAALVWSLLLGMGLAYRRAR